MKVFPLRLTRKRTAVAVIAGGAVAVTVAALWYWHFGWASPLGYGGDALLYDRLAKTIVERGWYLSSPLIGAPDGQVLYDYPLGSDTLHLVGLRALALVTANPFAIVNSYYYLSFPLVFLASWYALRRLGLAIVLAAPLAAVYALAPYHFSRNVTHLFLSGYFAVPLACLLLYDLLADTEDRGDTESDGDAAGQRSWSLRRFLRSQAFWLGRWLWVPVLLAFTGAYYAFFFILLALAIGVLGALYRRDWRLLRRPALVVGLTLAVLFVNNLPTFLYRMELGTNEVVAARKLGDSDIYALQWSHLLLPIDGHRLDVLADVRAKLHGSVSPLPAGEQDALGLIAAAGLVISIAALVAGGRARNWAALRRRSGVLNVLAVLLGGAGGASLLVGLLGFVQLRAYARLTVFIGFFSLVALGAALAPVLEAARRRRPRRTMAVATALALVLPALALLDHTRPTRPGGSADVAASRRDRRLATAIEDRLGPGATVLQVPLMGFPEDVVRFPAREPTLVAVIGGEEVYNGYELFRPSLYTDGVGWSYGRVQGRPGDVQAALAGQPVDRVLDAAAAAGFDGIYVDRAGVPDFAFQLESALRDRVGPPALSSVDNRMLFFDLRQHAHQWETETSPAEVEALRRQALHPLELDWGAGFGGAEGVGWFFPQLAGFTRARSGKDGAVLRVTNPTDEHRTLELHATARLGIGQTGRLTVGGQESTVAPQGSPVVIRVPVPPGRTRLTFRADGPLAEGQPAGPVAFRLDGLWWTG